jgi:hypothetical protein
MKKEEFPTFLNEKPTIIFGRTGRELVIIMIGLGIAYLFWLRLGNFVHGSVILSDIAKGILAAIVVVIAIIIAFVKVATRQLEEWAFVWLFYTIIPKVYVFLPNEESVTLEVNEKVVMSSRGNSGEDDEDF